MRCAFPLNSRFLYWIIYIGQVFLLLHFYSYATVTPFMYMTTFVIKFLNFSSHNASLLMSLFYGFQFAGRVIGVAVAAFARPGKMLIFNVSSTAVFYVILLAVVNVWPTIIWITIPLVGFSAATTLATVMLWISDRITITGRISSLVLVGHTSGAVVGPLIVGQLFERSTPMWFVYVLAFSSVIDLVLLTVLMLYDKHFGDRVTKLMSDQQLGLHGVAIGSRNNVDYQSIGEIEDRFEHMHPTEIVNDDIKTTSYDYHGMRN
jgi:fucose permease